MKLHNNFFRLCLTIVSRFGTNQADRVVSQSTHKIPQFGIAELNDSLAPLLAICEYHKEAVNVMGSKWYD